MAVAVLLPILMPNESRQPLARSAGWTIDKRAGIRLPQNDYRGGLARNLNNAELTLL